MAQIVVAARGATQDRKCLWRSGGVQTPVDIGEMN